VSDETLKVDCDRCGSKVVITPAGEPVKHHCRTPQEKALDAADGAARMLTDVRAEIAATVDEIPVERWATIAKLCREAQHEAQRARVALHAGAKIAREDAAARGPS